MRCLFPFRKPLFYTSHWSCSIASRLPPGPYCCLSQIRLEYGRLETGENAGVDPMIEGVFSFMEDLLAPKDLRHNKLKSEDRAFHNWYRFVLSYPPHLVRTYIHSAARVRLSSRPRRTVSGLLALRRTLWRILPPP